MKSAIDYINNVSNLFNDLEKRFVFMEDEANKYDMSIYTFEDYSYFRLDNYISEYRMNLNTAYDHNFAIFIYKILNKNWYFQFDSKMRYIKEFVMNIIRDEYYNFKEEENREL